MPRAVDLKVYGSFFIVVRYASDSKERSAAKQIAKKRHLSEQKQEKPAEFEPATAGRSAKKFFIHILAHK
jgi:hypothetical protein